MPLSCPIPYCYPEDTGCQEGCPTVGDCPHFQAVTPAVAVDAPTAELTGQRASWGGSALGLADLEPLAARSRVLLLGLAGMANAGKTTFLALLYSLLRQGHVLPGYRFAGSNTLAGWEQLAGFLTFRDSANLVCFPPHTTRNAGRVPGLLHLALRTDEGELLDVLLTDAPGEWFSEWRSHRQAPAAAGAEWLYQQSDGLLLFADCEELASPQRGAARTQLQMLADRLLAELGQRPLGLVWAKSDVANSRPAIRAAIQQHLQLGQPAHYREFAVSVRPGEQGEWHAQVLEAVAWLLTTVRREPGRPQPPPAPSATTDLFLLRRPATV